ncbi:MAG: hypothetical protein Q9162_004270 [Coniocarpon cinnabarinum]
MASEQRMYTISEETKDQLKKFRLGSSRAKEIQAIIYSIDKSSLEITPEATDPLKSLQALSDDLPENSPRFVLLSMPLTLSDGRSTVPYVMVSFMPPTCSNEQRMVYAGAKEMFRNEAGVARVLDVEDEEGVEGLEERLREG